MINTKLKNESIGNKIKSFYSKTDSLCSYLKHFVSVKVSLKKHLIWTTFSDVVLKKKKCYYPVQITPESVSRITGICINVSFLLSLESEYVINCK